MMVRPDSTSIMMDFFPPVKFYNVQVHYRRKFDSTCTEFFFVKETKWAIMLRFFFGVGREPQSFVLLMMRDVVRQLLDNMHLL